MWTNCLTLHSSCSGIIVKCKPTALKSIQYCCMLLQHRKRKIFQVLVKLMVKLVQNTNLTLSDDLPTKELVGISLLFLSIRAALAKIIIRSKAECCNQNLQLSHNKGRNFLRAGFQTLRLSLNIDLLWQNYVVRWSNHLNIKYEGVGVEGVRTAPTLPPRIALAKRVIWGTAQYNTELCVNTSLIFAVC